MGSGDVFFNVVSSGFTTADPTEFEFDPEFESAHCANAAKKKTIDNFTENLTILYFACSKAVSNLQQFDAITDDNYEFDFVSFECIVGTSN